MKSGLTLRDHRTTVGAAEVLRLAKSYFTKRSALYATFLDQQGPSHCTFRGQGGEEIVIGVSEADGVTRVTGSTYLFDMQIARFFSTLPSVPTSTPAPQTAAVST